LVLLGVSLLTLAIAALIGQLLVIVELVRPPKGF
jgi:hypothetical protein